jgi:isopentenyl diphosphate isomerase/L-lactate dehydrogenase-like FMN-dependent dehydrogenase
MVEFTTLQEMLLIAHGKLDPAVWDFINGGTEAEITLRRNRRGLDRLHFRQRVLRDVSRIDTSTTFLNHRLSIPVMMAPVGSLTQIDPAGALAVASASKAVGSLLIYSTFADPPLSVVRAKVVHPLILGLYVRGDESWLDAAVDEAVAAGCIAIAVVTEAPYYSRRERDLINGYRSRGSKSGTYASAQKILRDGGNSEAVAAAESRMVTARLTWQTIERIQKRSKLPIILKGISTAEDTRLAIEHGASAIYVSNHGGRQLDWARGCIEVLPEIVAAAKGHAEVILDGGIYRGTDVLKAIALGARAVCIGRLQCWALAAGGEAGLVRAMEILEEEIIIAMGLLGVTRLAELDGSYLVESDALEPADIMNPFPVVKERLARLSAMAKDGGKGSS